MDFKQFVGKECVWSGEFYEEETGFTHSYLLFKDGAVALFPDKDDIDTEPTILVCGLDVLHDHLKTALPEAQNIIKLSSILLPELAKKAEAPQETTLELRENGDIVLKATGTAEVTDAAAK